MNKNILEGIKRKLSPESKRRLKSLYERCVSIFYRNNLVKLAEIYRTDKWNAHWYAQHYQRHFHVLRKKKLKILEIGVGGDDDPKKGGASLRMWKKYFPNSMIYSIDIYDKSSLQEERIKIFRGSQANESFLREVFNEIGSLDIIIDDGSHINEHVISSFKVLFPLLKDGGIYVGEDLQTAYWPRYGGDSVNLNNTATSMGFFKSHVDGLNYIEFEKQGYSPTYFDTHITSVHFYHNMAFICKGLNAEKSYGTR
ncbi:MAG: class I SAM-dependent methyltransferase [Candidatus Omnitrophota bacterium]